MDTLLFRVAGLDVHKKFVMACVRITDSQTGQARQEIRRFDTMTDDLRRLREWLVAETVSDVAMESTGVFWKPIWNVLEGAVRLTLANAHELKQVPGRKTDVKDAQWIAHLMACGLITPSFVPDQQLAKLAQGRLREKFDQLQRALDGHVRPHHRFLLRQLLDQLQHLEAQIATFDVEIRAVLVPFLPVETEARLDAIPGVNRRTIEAVVAEIGTDMSHFPSEGHLCSWAGLCPTNDESAGKRKRTRIKPGDKWLKSGLVESARAAARTKDSYFKAQYSRLAARRGANRAAIAVAHSLLTVIYYVLSDPACEYKDLGVRYFDELNPIRQVKHLVKRL